MTYGDDPQLAFLRELVEDHATIAGDLVQLAGHTWAIHGSIAVDGDVLMAEYDTEHRARVALDALAVTSPEARAPRPSRTAPVLGLPP